MSKVIGKNVMVLITDAGVDKLYACAQSCTLNVSRETIETSKVGSGDWATFRPSKISFDGSITGLMNLDEPTMLTYKDLMAKMIAGTLLIIKFQRTDQDANTFTNQGTFYITKCSDEGPNGSLNTFSIDLKGTGPLITL